jgi:hypothetical protein
MTSPRLPSLIAVLSLIIALPAAGQDTTVELRAEIDRLQQSLKQKPVESTILPGMAPMIQNALKGASDALSAGQIYLSLERLSSAFDLLGGVRAVVDNSEAVRAGGMPAFETKWNQTSMVLAALEKESRGWPADDAAATLALRQAAQTRSGPLLEGGRGFAVSTAPADGLLYVGEAQGQADFVRFCETLRLPAKGSAWHQRSFLPELQALQEKTNAAFQPPRSIDQHPRFIALNSTLKLAGELDASKFYAGALYQYLEAVRHFGMLDAPALNAAAQSQLQEALAGTRKKLAASAHDDSIAQLFLERAEAQIAHPDGSAPSADEWKSAKIIVERVLPAYYAVDHAVTSPRQPAGKTAALTLVRWPYT